jgi:uncharacterized protein (TIGR02680 family)
VKAGLFEEAARPALPEPARSRWQPLRMGLVELYRYDSEEFWFRDGHLLLRGNNGTGKSKVLSLTLPLLFDASLRPARVEPDGDGGKRMAWNLLLGGAYDRRTGYAWIEFGRRADDGRAEFVTLGAGLHAVAARSTTEAWYFTIDGARLGRDLWLMNEKRVVHTRDRLAEALGAAGRVHPSADAYRRAVDEKLFQLGPARYAALMDTLIQLRQPQLSRRPDEGALSAALTEALPPLAQDLLADVAEALARLEEDRRQLEQTRVLLAAVQRFEQRYRLYAGIASRRQARALRQAQTEFDAASRARNEAAAQLTADRRAEDDAAERKHRADVMLAGARMRLETLQTDPLNQAAGQLEAAQRDARRRETAAVEAEADLRRAAGEAERETARTTEQARRVAEATVQLERSREEARFGAAEAGLANEVATHPFVDDEPGTLAALAPAAIDAAQGPLAALPRQRREQVIIVRRRLAATAAAEQDAATRRQALAEAQADAEDAAARRAEADAAIEAEGARHFEAWGKHLQRLQALRLEAEAVLAALTDWLGRTDGEHPALAALHTAQGAAALRLAAARHALEVEAAALADEGLVLAAERERLERGEDALPAVPAWRDGLARGGRPGAPLWQLVDFGPALSAAERAGLEAALEASGLLDAWVTPAGELLRADDGTPWLDAQWRARPPAPAPTLATHLHADPAAHAVPAAVVTALLGAVACGAEDPAAAEAWVATDGRFRLGTLAGAARRDEARFIGHAARATARERRRAEIAAREAEVARALSAVDRRRREADETAGRIEAEWRSAPSEQPLRRAHEAVAARSRELEAARRRAAEAEARWRRADEAAASARAVLAADAADLRLPADAAALDGVDERLHALAALLHALAAAVRLFAAACPELDRQRERAAEAAARQADRQRRLAARRVEHEEARTRLAALESAHGDDVQALKLRIARARAVVQRVETGRERHDETLRAAAAARARAEQRSSDADAAFTQRSEARVHQVGRWQAFAATGLLAAGLAGSEPMPELPDPRLTWTIEPALTLARRAEQALTALDDAEERWKRVQSQLAEDLAELQRTLGAMGHQAAAEPNDFGFAVHVVWQQRPEGPAELAAKLTAETSERQALLSAREREVLENHLQAEIASQVQRLMREAQAQTLAINAELHKRPTSTGVRFRLLWQPLDEGDGAPAGLHAARERLLMTSAELWSPEDRRVVGGLLQQRIQDERRRAEADVDAEGTLLEQLAAALDYRRWHRFRVERLQDGQWRRLSGPASSGERALGLTVPLFAAIVSFYRESPRSPRLMMLDEAFAGIDDSARAHCMGLVREFDLDFVITSEREWGCYAALPGVAICQLQRREGIDAVFVSRWVWDGQARRREADPARRFPAGAEIG